MNQYYGEKEILGIKDHPVHPTHSILIFGDGTEKVLSKKLVAVAITSEPVDLTKLRDLRTFPVVEAVLKEFLDFDIHISEIDYICQRAIMSINESLKVANEKLWGVEAREQSMLNVHDVLMNDAPQPAAPAEAAPEETSS